MKIILLFFVTAAFLKNENILIIYQRNKALCLIF